MSLSCSCDFDPSDYDSYYYFPNDFSTFKHSRRKRCVSCKKLIDIGATVIEFEKYRHPHDDIEERCKGDEIYMSSFYMCEGCGEIFLNLNATGLCMDVCNDSMQECLKEYHEMTGFTPIKKAG